MVLRVSSHSVTSALGFVTELRAFFLVLTVDAMQTIIPVALACLIGIALVCAILFVASIPA